MLNGNGSKAGAPATAAGWTGAVSRRPRSAKSPTKNVAAPRGGTLSKSTSKADPPALARSLTNSGKLLHGAKAKIDLLNETVAEVIPDYVPTPERLLKPQRQIPIGKTATKALRRELSKCNKPVAVTGPVDKRKVVRVLSESDAKRVHRQQADRTFRDWKAKKASTQVAERARRVEARKKKADEKAKTKASRAGAYEKWVERKQREAQKSTKKHRKRSVHTGGIAIDEFIASVRRNRYQPELLPLFEELLGVLDKERSGRVNRTAFHELLNQVALQDKIDARKEDIELDREANPLPEKTQDWTPEQRTALQKEKQQQRIGEKIMLHGATGIKALSALMKRVNRTFRMADEGLTGTLKDDALKACFKGVNECPMKVSPTSW